MNKNQNIPLLPAVTLQIKHAIKLAQPRWCNLSYFEWLLFAPSFPQSASTINGILTLQFLFHSFSKTYLHIFLGATRAHCGRKGSNLSSPAECFARRKSKRWPAAKRFNRKPTCWKLKTCRKCHRIMGIGKCRTTSLTVGQMRGVVHAACRNLKRRADCSATEGLPAG